MIRAILFLLLALPAFAGREFVAASSEHGGKSSSSITGYPFTIAAWVYPYSTNGNLVVSGLFSGNGTASGARAMIFIQNGVARLDVLSTGASTTAKLELNKWQHIAGVFSSSTSRTIYLNGANAVSDTTSQTLATMDKVAVGGRVSTTWGLFFDGLIAEVGYWNVALSASELLSLSVGAAPESVRPASLRHVFPFTGQDSANDWDLCGTQLGLTNTPAASANHPRIYNP